MEPPKFPKDDSTVSKKETPESKGARPCRHCGSGKHWDNECRHSFRANKFARANLATASADDECAQEEYDELYYNLGDKQDFYIPLQSTSASSFQVNADLKTGEYNTGTEGARRTNILAKGMLQKKSTRGSVCDVVLIGHRQSIQTHYPNVGLRIGKLDFAHSAHQQNVFGLAAVWQGSGTSGARPARPSRPPEYSGAIKTCTGAECQIWCQKLKWRQYFIISGPFAPHVQTERKDKK
ncbi:hypothetical protein DFH08DRAFT_992492 [Mycena albidolilacea]|uniref:Uncharacterized protein n=1 Tax=Mycena albidolilacea TaxID=1033008 RepID=A0AAD7A891_9AGAR|nr:hypothetical protein DFH08DRAFT_992492 [Mycena albidolilacea]